MQGVSNMQERLLELQSVVDEAAFLRNALYLEAEGFIRLEERDGEIYAVPL